MANRSTMIESIHTNIDIVESLRPKINAKVARLNGRKVDLSDAHIAKYYKGYMRTNEVIDHIRNEADKTSDRCSKAYANLLETINEAIKTIMLDQKQANQSIAPWLNAVYVQAVNLTRYIEDVENDVLSEFVQIFGLAKDMMLKFDAIIDDAAAERKIA